MHESAENIKEEEVLNTLSFALWGTGVAAITLGLASIAHSSDVTFLSALAGGLFLSFSLIIPRSSVFVSIFVLLLSCLLLTPILPFLLRISVFALIINLPRRSRFEFPPFISVSVLWALVLLGAAYFSASEYPALYSLETLTLTRIILEIGLCLFLGFATAIGGLPVGLLYNQRPSLSSFINHLGGLICYGLVLIAVAIAAKLSDMPVVIFIQQKLLEPLPVLLILGLLMMVPLFLALGIEYLFSSFTNVLRKVVFQPDELSDVSGPPIQEVREVFDDISEFQLGQIDEIKFKDSLLSQLDTGLQQSQDTLRELRMREADALEVLEHAPFGMAVIKPDGTIDQLNKSFCEYLNTERSACVGEPFDSLIGTHPWAEDIVSVVIRVREDDETKAELLENTKSYQDALLHVFARVINEVTLVYVEKQKLPNQFQLQALSPASIELHGTRAIDLCKSTKDDCTTLLREMGEIPQSIAALGNSAATREEQNEALLGLSVKYKKLESSLRDISEEIQKVVNQFQANDDTKESIDLHGELLEALTFLSQVMMLEHPINLKLEEVEPADLLIQAVKAEFTNFLSHLLGVLRQLLDDHKDTQIILGKEHIGSATANIIPGSYPGEYLRILISHPEKSSLGSMAHRSVPELNQLEGVECSFYLLTAQVKRLGGFSSVRSSASRGSEITLYLPQTEALRIDETLSREASPSKMESRQTDVTALVVGSDNDSLAKLSKILGELGYEAGVKRPDTLLDDFNAPLDFSGSGFSERIVSEKGTALELLNKELENFEILVVIAATVDAKTKSLLSQLGNYCPKAKKLTIVDPVSSTLPKIPGWTIVEQPFDEVIIKAAIDNQ